MTALPGMLACKTYHGTAQYTEIWTVTDGDADYSAAFNQLAPALVAWRVFGRHPTAAVVQNLCASRSAMHTDSE